MLRRLLGSRLRALMLLTGVALLQVSLGTTLLAGSSTSPALTLTSDVDGQALVRAANVTPGRTLVRCLQLRYTDAVAGDQLRLQATASDAGLGDYLGVAIEAGTGGSALSCSGFVGTSVFQGTLAELTSRYGSPDTTLLVRQLPTGDGTTSVRLRFVLRSDNRAQGTAANSDLLWLADPVGDRSAPPPVVTPVQPPAHPTPADPTPADPAPAPAVPAPTTPTRPAPAQPAPVPPSAAPPTVPAMTPPDPATPAGTPNTEAPRTSVPNVPTTGATGSAAPTVSPAPSGPPSQTTSPATPAAPPGGSGVNDAGSGGGPNGVLGRGTAAIGHAISHGVSGVTSAVGAAAGHVAHVLSKQVLKPVQRAAAPVARGATYGLGGSAPLLGMFLLVQSRIDRKDPKLALAPTYADPELTFDHIPRGPLKHRGNA